MQSNRFTFPEGFLWGVSGSAAQMEGAIFEDGKSWDAMTYNFYYPRPGKTSEDYLSPKVACDYYHRYAEDHDLFRKLGVGAFRFSISWTRVCPDISCTPNQRAIDHYNAVIDDMLEKGITPFFDLWHSDLPRWVIDNGGIPDERFVDWFTRYAEVCFRAFGDRVKYWSTMNEPKLKVYGAYSHAQSAPYLKDEALAFKATQNANLAHFAIVRKLREICPDAKIGSVHCLGSCYSLSFDPEDVTAARRHQAMQLIFLDPMMRGEYPEEVLAYPESAQYIPQEYIDAVRREFCPMDFYGINYYQPNFVKSGHDTKYGTEYVQTELPKDAYPFTNYAPGLYDLLIDLNDRYEGAPALITENGYAYRCEDVYHMDQEDYRHDGKRVNYIREHLRECARAIRAGVNLQGYFYWSAMDCWESSKGYGYPMGLIGIDLNTLERVPRDSYEYYRQVIAHNMVD